LLDSGKISEIKHCTNVYKQKNFRFNVVPCAYRWVTAIVNRARTHASSIAACVVACIEADNRAG